MYWWCRNMQNLIYNILSSSIENLFSSQPNILKHTSETTMTEWNLAHHYSNEVSKYIFWLDHDIDVVKRRYHNKRPDIIYHKRGTNDYNFLVIEIKIDQNILPSEIERIKKHWFSEPLRYEYGACVSLMRANISECKVEVFKNGKETEQAFTYEHIKIPKQEEKYLLLKNNPPLNKDLKLKKGEIYDVFKELFYSK